MRKLRDLVLLPAPRATSLRTLALLVAVLLAGHRARAQEAPPCLPCHQALVDRQSSHAIARMGMCTVCHVTDTAATQDTAARRDTSAVRFRPHPAFSLRARGAALCETCHAMIADTTSLTHLPVRTGMCLGCHDPHGSTNSHLVKAVQPDLCYACHASVRDAAGASRVPHRALYVVNGCGNCHDPHRAAQPRLLRMRTDSLCLGCHDREYDSPRGRIGNVARVLRGSAFGHFPAQAGMCTTCHETHGGQRPRLLAADYSIELYGESRPSAYALCGTCHSLSALAAAVTDSTGFRHGRRNLHAVHVREPGRNRTCHVCHEPHAADNPRMIRASVPFGSWMLPIGFRVTERGGVCAPACHEPRAYDRTATDSAGAGGPGTRP